MARSSFHRRIAKITEKQKLILRLALWIQVINDMAHNFRNLPFEKANFDFAMSPKK